MAPNPIQQNNTQVDFHQWKQTLDSIFVDIFHQTSENLPDMPYREMYQEGVEENLIVLRMFKLLGLIP